MHLFNHGRFDDRRDARAIALEASAFGPLCAGHPAVPAIEDEPGLLRPFERGDRAE